MCGPTSQEEELQGQSQAFSTLLQGNYNTLFGNQLNVLNSINRSLSPILAAGPSQQGFSAPTLAAMNTQAINASGAASRNAQQAVANFGAGQGGGGSSGLISGVQRQLQGAVASQSANQYANAQNNITLANYSQGNTNFWRAQGGADQLAAGYSPNSAQGGAISANQTSFGEASAIQQQQQQEDQMIAGGVTALAMGGASFAAGAMNGGGLQGGLQALSGGGYSNSGNGNNGQNG
jgi:hypothetical protein